MVTTLRGALVIRADATPVSLVVRSGLLPRGVDNPADPVEGLYDGTVERASDLFATVGKPVVVQVVGENTPDSSECDVDCDGSA